MGNVRGTIIIMTKIIDMSKGNKTKTSDTYSRRLNITIKLTFSMFVSIASDGLSVINQRIVRRS